MPPPNTRCSASLRAAPRSRCGPETVWLMPSWATPGRAGLGTALTSTLTGNAYNGNFVAGDSLHITVQGAGLSGPVNLTQTATTGAGSAASTAVLIQGDVAANAALAAAGITVTNTAGHMDFTSASGGAVSVSI